MKWFHGLFTSTAQWQLCYVNDRNVSQSAAWVSIARYRVNHEKEIKKKFKNESCKYMIFAKQKKYFKYVFIFGFCYDPLCPLLVKTQFCLSFLMLVFNDLLEACLSISVRRPQARLSERADGTVYTREWNGPVDFVFFEH